MVLHWGLSEIKSLQVSRTLLSILADLDNAVVCLISTRPLISKSSSPFINLLVTEPRVPITIGIAVTFMFHNFFHFPTKVEVLILLFVFFSIVPADHSYSVVSRDSKVHNSAKKKFLTIFRSGCLAKIRWFVCILKSQWSLCVSFSRTDSQLCIFARIVKFIIMIIHLVSFSLQQWSLNETKSPQVSRTPLSILANFNNFVFSMVSILLPFPFILVPFPCPWRPFQVCQLPLISPSPSCSTTFLVLWQGLSIYLSFCSLSFPLCGLPERQNPRDGKFIIFVLFLLINTWSDLSNRDYGIRLYFKVPENFIRLLLYERFWFYYCCCCEPLMRL